jgi:ribosomal protein S18 acetylase RimI-like enzyme
MMTKKISFRSATVQDIDFVIDTICEAEKMQTDRLSYCKIFQFSEMDFRNMLRSIFEEEIEGQEFYLPDFVIAEIDGVSAAACTSWIEAESGVSSSILKMNILSFFVTPLQMSDATERLKLVSSIQLAREQGSLQIESVYTLPTFRGLGIASKLIDYHIQKRLAEGKKFEKVQVITALENESAVKAYQKLGFKVITSKTNAEVLSLLPAPSKCLLEKKI